MAYFLTDIHFWSLKYRPIIPPQDIGCFGYHEKNEQVIDHQIFQEERIQYTEGRDVTWRVRNKRPIRLKDNLKELEEILSTRKCVRFTWRSKNVLQMLLNNGIVVSLVVSEHTGDVDRIYIDKSLVGKLSADVATDVLLTEHFMLVAYPDRSKIDFVLFTKKPAGNKKFEKLSSLEPKIFPVDVPGPVGRKLIRRLTPSADLDMVACWWSTGGDDVSPWTPMTGDKELANIVLLAVGSSKVEPVSYTRTPGDLVSVEFSRVRPQQILTVEQISTSPHSHEVLVNTYECSKNKMFRIAATSIPLKAGLLCCDRSPAEDRIVLGCTDASVALYDVERKITRVTKAAVVPAAVHWHPSGSVFVAVSSTADVQLFDVALSPLPIQPVAENVSPVVTLSLSAYFKSSWIVSHVCWTPLASEFRARIPECSDMLAFVFANGPIGVVTFYLGVTSQGLLSPLQLVNQYIRCRQIPEAVSILKALNWNTDGKLCFACLSAIVNQLLKVPLNETREGLLQEALGTFYSSPRQLADVTILEHRDPIHRLARRFFHQLVRHCRFEKAFLLAVDIGAHDLFMDIHYAAADKGEKALAEVALRKAEQLTADVSSIGSELVPDGENSDDSFDPLDRDDLSDGDEIHAHMPVHCRPSSHVVRQPKYSANRPHTCDAADLVRAQLDAALLNDLSEEFTECFVQLAPNSTPAARETRAADDGSAAVHVIHFGVI